MHRALSVAIAITALLALLFGGVASSSARKLELSNQNFRIVFSPLNAEIGSPEAPLSCTLTLEGSFHYRTLVKSIGALIGYVTTAIIRRPCEGFGEAWAYNGTEGSLTSNLNSLPWHITYEGFTGTLPKISSFRLLLRGWRVVIRGLFGFCLSIYGPNRNMNLIARRNTISGAIKSIEPDPTVSYTPESNPGGECGSLEYDGLGLTTVLGSTEAITVRLF